MSILKKSSRDKKFHIVYKTTNTLNGIYYIGVHSTNEIEDGYLGSGLILLKAIKKHGKDKFSREVVRVFKTREEAYSYESSIVTEDLIKSRVCYNRAVGGQGGYLGEEAIEKMRKSKLGISPWNKGITKTKSCKDCDKRIPNKPSRKQTRCESCYHKTKVGKGNISWKNTYIIEDLEYHSLIKASEVTGIPKTTLFRWCKDPKKSKYSIK